MTNFHVVPSSVMQPVLIYSTCGKEAALPFFLKGMVPDFKYSYLFNCRDWKTNNTLMPVRSMKI